MSAVADKDPMVRFVAACDWLEPCDFLAFLINIFGSAAEAVSAVADKGNPVGVLVASDWLEPSDFLAFLINI